MARRKRRARQNPVRKWARMAVSALGKVFGGVAIGFPALQAWNESGGNLETFADRVRYRYTGLQAGGNAVDWTQTGRGIGSVVAGIALVKLFSIASKHF